MCLVLNYILSRIFLQCEQDRFPEETFRAFFDSISRYTMTPSTTSFANLSFVVVSFLACGNVPFLWMCNGFLQNFGPNRYKYWLPLYLLITWMCTGPQNTVPWACFWAIQEQRSAKKYKFATGQLRHCGRCFPQIHCPQSQYPVPKT